MRTTKFLQFLLIKLAALPKRIHFIVNLLGVECSQLFSQLFQPYC